MENLEKISDQNLYQLCKTYGARALEWRRKFTGLLAEVNKRKLFEKKGFGSIFEFAKKLAGLSEKQVRLVLNLEERFESMPKLKSLLINGDVSINKLARITSIANFENEEFLAEQVKILSKNAVETLVRDEKSEMRNGLFETKNQQKSLPGQTCLAGRQALISGYNELHISFEVYVKLLELQQKGFDINALLAEFFKKREEEISEKKEQISAEVLRNEEEKIKDGKEIIRHIPMKVRKILEYEYGQKCTIPYCNKLASQIHHTRRFSLSRSHDPRYLAPLCKAHHELAHATDVRVQKMRSLAMV